MHSIGLLVGVLREGLREPTLRQLADKVQTSVQSMEGLFGSLLDISKLDAGAMRPLIENVDAGWLLQRVALTWMPQAAERRLRLRVRVSPLIVRGDAALLERMVGNLISNALRYTACGGVLLSCRRRGRQCELRVWDTGVGIDERHREAIFEEFFRIDAPGLGVEKGLGLGLSIVQRGARMLGYALRVDSRVGRGSVFTLTMPCADAPASSGVLLRHPAESATVEGAFIVVVDDDEDNRLATLGVLRAWGCHVLSGGSADEVLGQSQEHLRAPDLILTDYRLKGATSGFDVVAALRNYHEEPIRALLVTADTGAEVREQADALDVRVLHKPVGVRRLFEAISAELARAETA
jgi:CheY-like chemotaxis protein/two-component sensor histidine kinase